MTRNAVSRFCNSLKSDLWIKDNTSRAERNRPFLQPQHVAYLLKDAEEFSHKHTCMLTQKKISGLSAGQEHTQHTHKIKI